MARFASFSSPSATLLGSRLPVNASADDAEDGSAAAAEEADAAAEDEAEDEVDEDEDDGSEAMMSCDAAV